MSEENGGAATIPFFHAVPGHLRAADSVPVADTPAEALSVDRSEQVLGRHRLATGQCRDETQRIDERSVAARRTRVEHESLEPGHLGRQDLQHGHQHAVAAERAAAPVAGMDHDPRRDCRSAAPTPGPRRGSPCTR